MSVRSLHNIALVVALGGLAGCSGGAGGSTGSASFSCAGTSPRAICLQNCNLGCSATGCSRTDIAQNEVVILQFSEAIDPATVGPSSIRFRTASGEQPVGEFFVNGNQVEFVPTLAISGGQTFFGFSAGDTYTLTIPGGETQPAVVRSTSGKPFEKTLTCTLRSSLGIVDLNGVPPRASLVVPSQAQLADAPRETDIVIEFNELIDATPFLSGTQSPVTFAVRRNRAAAGGGFECDPASQLQTLSGTQRLDFDGGRGVSVLTFSPSQDLPGNVCVEINVTNGVADLSGRPAQPQSFVFRTVVVPLTEERTTEEFVDDTKFDADASAGRWGADVLTFANIGGDGRHGPFSLSWCTDTALVTSDGKRIYRVNCDNTTIPALNTTTGSPIAITDGKFFLTTMVVPSDVRLEFLGSSPPQITVAGRLDILGDIFVAGQSLTAFPLAAANPGQPGAAGGIFGGAGGKGGDRNILGTTTGASAVNQGASGSDARVLSGHAYAPSTFGSGGRGSTVFPASGLNTAIQFPPAGTPPPTIQTAISAVAGGAGGGTWLAGGIGRVVSNNAVTPPPGLLAAMGPDALGGTAVTLFPFPAGTGFTRSSLHFLLGGGGGGGAASQACMCFSVSRGWAPGAGGGGGGGAVALRAGDSLRLGPAGRILAFGGAAAGSYPAGSLEPTATTASSAQPAPGGGGGGGSVVLQSGRAVDLLGLIDVRGGRGGFFHRTGNSGNPPGGAIVKIAGGDGASGFVRLEAPVAPPLGALATMQPAATADNVAALVEVDDIVSVRSKYYSTGQLFGPEYARYEIHALVDNVPIVYSDDPAFGVPAQTNAAVRALFQSARLELGSGAVLEVGPWRTAVRSVGQQTGIASDAFNGFRFMLFLDRTISNNVTIQKVVVAYRI